jgi:ABC-type transport system involved in cytochrome c biogenesis permease subunit
MEFFFLLAWLGLSGAVAAIASSRGRSAGGFFVLSIVISPLIAGIIAMAMGPAGKKCPRCGETPACQRA